MDQNFKSIKYGTILQQNKSKKVHKDFQLQRSHTLAMISPRKRKTQSKKVIVVLHSLPLNISKNGNGTWQISKKDEGFPITGAEKGLMKEEFCKKWIYVGGVSIPDLTNEDKKDLQYLIRSKYNCVPVFVNEPQWIYFCKQSLWPCLNSQLSTKNWDPIHWKAYKRTNDLFAKTLVESGILSKRPEKDLIWVQDYHLLLVPGMLRMYNVNCGVGLFVHTCWPTSEIFRILPMRSSILKGMLGAEIIGFQTHNYTHHFLNACSRILAADVSPNVVNYAGNSTAVNVCPVGIDLPFWQTFMVHDSITEKIQNLKKTFANKKIIVGIDRLDPVMGVCEKLIAFADFLERYPQWQSKIILFQVCLPPSSFLVFPNSNESNSPENTNNYQNHHSIEDKEVRQLRASIRELVGKINGKYSTADFTPIRYLDYDIDREDICALYCIADILLLTPLRDGMNLICQEYEICTSIYRQNQYQKQLHKNNKLQEIQTQELHQNQQQITLIPYGIQILSEFAGASLSLSGAFIVNPWDVKGVSSCIHESLTLSHQSQSRRLRHEINVTYVANHTAVHWAKMFLFDQWPSASTAFSLTSLSRGGGALQHLCLEEAVSAFSQAKRRVLIFNYDGVLTPITRNYMDATLSSHSLQLLARLCSSPSSNSSVYIITGRDRSFMESITGKVPIGLACEYGVFFKPSGQSGKQSWQNYVEDVSWKDAIRGVLEDFTDRTPSSIIEEKEVSITWHYRGVEPEFASFQVSELMSNLQSLASKLPIDIIQMKKAIEIRPQNVNNASIVRKIMGSLVPDADFVLCVGTHDQMDEEMYTVLEGYEPTVLEQATKSNNHHWVSTNNKRGILHKTAPSYIKNGICSSIIHSARSEEITAYPTRFYKKGHKKKQKPPLQQHHDNNQLQKPSSSSSKKNELQQFEAAGEDKIDQVQQTNDNHIDIDDNDNDDDDEIIALAPNRVFCCTMGKASVGSSKSTTARYYVRNSSELTTLLKALRDVTVAESLTKSQRERKGSGRRCMSSPHIHGMLTTADKNKNKKNTF